MNKKKILVLSAVIVVLLGLLAWVVMLDSPDSVPEVSSDLQEQTDVKSYDEVGDIYRCSIDSIQSITVTLPSESFTFIKTDGMWTCNSLPGGTLNSSKVSTLATRLSTLGYVEVFDEDVTAEDCSITDASPSVLFTSDMGEIILKISDSFNDDKLSYASVSVSELVYSVKKEAVESFFEPLSSYRNDSLLNVSADSVSEIELSNANGIMRFQKGQVDRQNAVFNEWRMILPVEISASDSAIAENIFDALDNMKISGYADDSGNFEAYGLDAGDKYVSLTESGGRVRTLYFGNKKDGMYYVRVDDSASVYTVEESMLSFVSVKPIDLADRHINLVMKDSLSAIDVKSDDGTYSIKVSPNKNESSVNDTVLDETEFSRNVFTSVCGLVADDIYTGDTGDAEVTVIYTYVDGTTDKMEYATYDDRFYTVSINGSARFMAQKSKIEEMFKALEQYK